MGKRSRNKGPKEPKGADVCKLFGIAGIGVGLEEPERKKAEAIVWKLLTKISGYMTKYDDDGFGYAAIGGGELYGERWFNPSHAWRLRQITLPKRYEEIIDGSPNGWNHFGPRRPKQMNAVIAHARKATGPKHLQNVHPFVKENIALIHNGIIHTDAAKNTDCHTGPGATDYCDSMAILSSYLKKEVPFEFDNIKEAIEDLSGSQACLVLGHDGMTWYMDAWRNEGSTLSILKVQNGDKTFAHIFATDPTHVFEAIKDVNAIKDLGADLWTQTLWKLTAGKAVRFNALTGEIIAVQDFRSETTYRSSVVSPGSYGITRHYPNTSSHETPVVETTRVLGPGKSLSEVKPQWSRTEEQEKLAAKGAADEAAWLGYGGGDA